MSNFTTLYTKFAFGTSEKYILGCNLGSSLATNYDPTIYGSALI